MILLIGEQKIRRISPHNKEVAVNREIETMSKKLTILRKQTEVQASATLQSLQ